MIDYGVSDGVCLLRLDAPPVNAIGPALLDALRAAIGRANEDAAVRGIIVAGDPDHFSAGADVGLFRDIRGPEDAVHTSRIFQDAFQAVEDSGKPVVAAVAGRMMGSALELAMACHARVCTRATRFGMPEVTLGINPGAGGTQRLPRLVGVRPALDMLLAAKTVDAEQALNLGLVDAVCDGADLLERARAVLVEGSAHRRTSVLAAKVGDRAANEEAFREAEDRLARGRPEIVAPVKILEAVRTGLEQSYPAGLAKERTGFAECMETRATRNRIYLFFATREMSRAPAGAGAAPAEITQAAVIGMGSMGTGIARALAASGIPVVAWDENPTAVERGIGRIRGSLEQQVAQGRLEAERAEGTLALLSAADGWAAIGGAGLIIEAVFEDVEVKRAVLRQVEAACADDAIIASNTSTISFDDLAAGLRRPDRLVGMHFFNPAHRMPLVEVIRHDATTDGVVATALAFAKRIRKTPVLVRNREGFLVNRLFIPYLKEAFELLAEGADATAIDTAMVDFGFPMGPLALIDMAGLDILVHTDRVLTRAFPRHGRLSPVAVRLVEGGRLGQKTGSGVYRYERGDRTPRPSEATARIVEAVRREAGAAPRDVGADEIARRLTMRMVNEAGHVMAEGIVRRESDLDAATVLGMGFPDFRGGVLRYARDVGPGKVLSDLERLAAECGERYSPCAFLREIEGAES